MTIPQVIICKPNLTSFIREAKGKVYVMQVQQSYPQSKTVSIHLVVSGLTEEQNVLRYEFTASIFKSYLDGQKRKPFVNEVIKLEKQLVESLKTAGFEVHQGLMTFSGYEIAGEVFAPERQREGVEL